LRGCSKISLVPAKAGTQFWIPAFAGRSGIARNVALSGLVMTALALVGCGRAGPLEPPPGPAAVPSAQLTQPDGSPAPGSPQDTAVKSGFDSAGNPVATGQKRSFILDPLLR
jgi:predicted small lipoprotein YifL